MYFRECPRCGAHLDPGEPCDCREVEKEAAPAATGTTSAKWTCSKSTSRVAVSHANGHKPSLSARRLEVKGWR